MKPLMMMRTRGISGPRFGKHANLNHTLSKSSGSFFGAGGAGVYLKVMMGDAETVVDDEDKVYSHSHKRVT